MQLSRSRGKIGQGVPSSRARRTATHRPRRALQSASASRLSTLFFGSFHIRTGPGADRQSPANLRRCRRPIDRLRYIASRDWPARERAEAASLLDHYVLPKYDDPVICTYDLSKFSAGVVMDIMRTHPVVIIGGVLQENPFFVPPDQFLLELRERRRSARAR
jgi:hypothetical protein